MIWDNQNGIGIGIGDQHPMANSITHKNYQISYHYACIVSININNNNINNNSNNIMSNLDNIINSSISKAINTTNTNNTTNTTNNMNTTLTIFDGIQVLINTTLNILFYILII
jgi:hypothetical protein